ncbi:hypothetical protein [Nocardia flavorosea]|uniref:Uncharacterized protein n=1 Tax=Nocardia flavorosea TaxID=53429 RepID=A0A846YIU3_9NOCA|nr:hypothetical protein [Nocardia flavorosea]NKY57564.1 hypothetical protein [Nocardia flavorosea]
MNPWSWNDRNPYYETAFQVLDVDPTADRATVRARIATRRRRIAYDAGRFPLFGETLTVARVNAAEEQLAAPRSRLAAELLTHPVGPDGDDLATLCEMLELSRALDAASNSGAAPVQDHDLHLDYRVLSHLLPPPIDQEPTA